MSHLSKVQITLIGKTGVGKSAVGNTILGRTGFTSASGSSSVTRRCQEERAVVEGCTVTVVDTPDFFHSTHDGDLVSEIDRSVTLSPPGVHAFLYVLNPTAFTKQEAETVSRFKQTYGEKVLRYTIVVFTHGDELQLHRVDMGTLISQNESLMNFVTLCGGRFTVLNNEAPADRQQVHYLLGMIDRMVSGNEESVYVLEMLQEARRRTEELGETSSESARIKHQRDLERVRRETEMRVRRELEEELEEELEKAGTERADENGAEGEMEISSAEQELQQREWKLICSERKGKWWLILQRKELLFILFFSVAFGCLLSGMSADRWAWLRGGCLGAAATAGGLITGKALVLVQRSPFRTSCVTDHQECPRVPYRWKKVFLTICSGLVGSSVVYAGSHEMPLVVLGGLSGGFAAFTATVRPQG